MILIDCQFNSSYDHVSVTSHEHGCSCQILQTFNAVSILCMALYRVVRGYQEAMTSCYLIYNLVGRLGID